MKKFLLSTSVLLTLAACNNKPTEPTGPSGETATPERPNVTININQPPQTPPAATPAPTSPTPAPPPAKPPAATPPVAAPKPDVARRLRQERVAYVCDNGETVELRLFPAQGVAALWRGGKPTELHQVKAYPPSFLYEAGPVASVEGTPESFTMQVGAMALTKCQVKK